MPPVGTEALAGDTVIVASTGAAVTVTAAVPVTLLPLLAVTVNGPPVVGPAVKSPVGEIVPPLVTVQVKVGCGVSDWLN